MLAHPCVCMQLMLTNSVVLFQRQPFIEYFYRSLKPWVHYIPFWNETGRDMDDVYAVVGELRRRDAREPAAVQAIVAEAQSFAIRFTLAPARFQYLKQALQSYKELFGPSMDSFLESFVAGLRARGFAIA
ncbi:KDEL motif-containing protein 2 [Tetrabaena socialis]|uniref:KDEL motif-containing protein 2 n=1 Tax=Tetrabaena socialis TaxID=47790 RepID=A0A2J8AFC4_9CHLO|nr:KDEL motif-containing protein 2 [Tetrabaena socialis]|eukprot:PNH11214.1 KDEL motif-containing protein 2 [Tetrabaena socialis]